MKTIICIIALIALSSAVNLRMEKNPLQRLSIPDKEEIFFHFPMLAQMTEPLSGIY